MQRLFTSACLVCALVIAAPATSSAQQSINLYVGGFAPHDIDGRDDDDALVGNLFNGDLSLDFDIDDFNGGTAGVEWLTALGPHLEAGLGVGFYRKTVNSVYADFVEDDGTEIEQDLRLRIVPFSATIRLLPFSRDAAVQPYIGAGVGVFAWRYSEVGEFLDPFPDVRQDRFIGSGTAAGPILIGGARFPVGPWDIGGEVRYQSAKGDLPEGEFLGTTIDLGGFNYLLTFNVRF